MKHFIDDIGCKSKIMRADCDFKLIAGTVTDYLKTPMTIDKTLHTTHISGGPDNRQKQNGRIESHWKQILILDRLWLASNPLPTKFWYFAVKQAVQVCNYTHI